MKLLLFLLVLICGTLSTNAQNSGQMVSMPDIKMPLSSTITQNSYIELEKKLDEIANTPSKLNDEQLCKSQLQTMLNDGILIRSQILQGLKNAGKDNDTDYEFFKNMSDTELVSLSFLVYNLNVIKALNTGVEADYLSWGKVKDCLGFAVGIAGLKDLSLKGVLTATTLRSTIIAIGKRYLGYIGLVLMISDFYDCFYNKQPEIVFRPNQPDSKPSEPTIVGPSVIEGVTIKPLPTPGNHE